MKNLKAFNVDQQLMRALYAYIAKEIHNQEETKKLLKTKGMPKDGTVPKADAF